MLKETIEIFNVRDLSYDEARREIETYIKKVGHPVYISELASNLHIDIQMIIDVMKNLQGFKYS